MMRSPNYFDPEQSDERNKYHKIDGHVLRETPVLAGMAETAASNIETARFRGDRRADENQHEQSQDRQSSAVENPKDDREPA